MFIIYTSRLGLMGVNIETIPQEFRNNLYILTSAVLNEAISTENIHTGW